MAIHYFCKLAFYSRLKLYFPFTKFYMMLFAHAHIYYVLQLLKCNKNIRGATLDFLLHISAHILVIIGFRHPDQIAKVCTLTCFYTLVALNSNFKTLIDGVILAKQASSSESNQTLY